MRWRRRIKRIPSIRRIICILVERTGLEPVGAHAVAFVFVWSLSSTADLSARSWFLLQLVRSGMDVVAGARIAFPYLLKVNEALLGTSEYERDFNYSGSRVRDDKLEQVPTVSPEVVVA